MYLGICVCMCVCMFVYMYVCMYVVGMYVCVRVYVCMYVRTYICIFVCFYLCLLGVYSVREQNIFFCNTPKMYKRSVVNYIQGVNIKGVFT